MTADITYFYSTYSAYAYIGHKLFEQISESAGRSIIHRPFHINRCLENIGAQSWEDRTQANLDYHFQRQRDRWSEYRSVEMPKVTPISHSNEALVGDKAIIVAEALSLDLNGMSYLLMSQHWQHDLDLSNLEQVRTCLNQMATTLIRCLISCCDQKRRLLTTRTRKKRSGCRYLGRLPTLLMAIFSTGKIT